MRLFFCYEKGFHKCNLYTKIFDSISVQRSLSEQKDYCVNFMVQALQNQFLDCGGLFRLLQERWHHLRHLTISGIFHIFYYLFSFWDALVTSKARPLTIFFFIELFQCCIPSVWLKYFSTRWISIFSSRAVSGIALKPNRSSFGRSLDPSIAATTWTLFVKHSSMILSFSNGLSFEKGLGLLITPLLFGLQQSDNCGFCSPGSSFLFHFWRHFNFS